MKRYGVRLIALILAAALLTGCAGFGDYQRLKDLYFGSTTNFSHMEYVRPDPDDFLEAQSRCLTLAAEGKDLNALTDAIWDMYDEYDHFYTMYTLADIYYCRDMSDLYWQPEHAWCQEKSHEVEAGLDQLLYALAASPLRKELESDNLFGAGYFDSYQGESVRDEEMTALMEEESALSDQYNALIMDLPGEKDPGYRAAAMEIVEIYARLITLRQQQAALAGYDDYISLANDLYYSRDFSRAQVENYLAGIREHLVPIYRQVYTMDSEELGCYQAQKEQVVGYLSKAARNMGGVVAEAFQVMESASLYDLDQGENRYPASYEVYLLDYELPYVFLSPEGTNYDALAFAHEFGHFCNDYASYGSVLNTDCAEVLSQGMEYLSLCYAGKEADLTRLKMADSLYAYVEQAAYTEFEYAAYSLSAEELTAENLVALYEEVTAQYGFDVTGYDGTELVDITHFFTYPGYVVSYIISNDAAMQIYRMELEKPGAGLKLYEKLLASNAWTLDEFLKEADLQSPFAPGRVEEAARIFRETFGG